MSILSDTYDINLLVPIRNRVQLESFKKKMDYLLRTRLDGHDYSFRIYVEAEYVDEWDSGYDNLWLDMTPDKVFNTIDENDHIFKTVWGPGDLPDIMSYLESELFKLNKNNTYSNFQPTHIKFKDDVY